MRDRDIERVIKREGRSQKQSQSQLTSMLGGVFIESLALALSKKCR